MYGTTTLMASGIRWTAGAQTVISGKGTGTVQDEQTAGTLDGSFTFLTETGSEVESYEAQDHRFKLIRQ
jgi:hypothetical protein